MPIAVTTYLGGEDGVNRRLRQGRNDERAPAAAAAASSTAAAAAAAVVAASMAATAAAAAAAADVASCRFHGLGSG